MRNPPPPLEACYPLGIPDSVLEEVSPASGVNQGCVREAGALRSRGLAVQGL